MKKQKSKARKSSPSLPSNSEAQYLQALIRDFPVDRNLNSTEAVIKIGTRFIQLEDKKALYLKFIRNIRNNPLPLFELLWTLNRAIHNYLFNEILSKAGQFRKKTDPNNGFVGFGSDRPRNPSQTQFKDSNPDLIETELSKTFNFFSETDSNPIRTSILFYQKFVLIHPFYDANGRIARYIVSLYLLFHGYYVQWKIIEERHKEKFIKKLNQCHNRVGQPTFDQYFEYLHLFWKKFIIRVDELEK